MFTVSILTLFPEMFPGPLGYSIAGRFLGKSWSLNIINIRDFGIGPHKKVDDEAFGGGRGLIMRPDVIAAALDFARQKYDYTTLYYPSPRGKVLTQQTVKDISYKTNIAILCGRFEGLDERILEEYDAVQISVGDYILSGGELPALTMLDAVIRILPGVINDESKLAESFEQDGEFNGLLEPPLYTRPQKWRDKSVPEVLVSGNHAQIAKWKHEQSISITKKLRPDLC